MPLLKRMAGSEFCSDAHRREYQQEFSELALGRLMQANPAESQAQPLKAPLLASVSPPLSAEGPPASAANGTGAAVKPSATPAWVEKPRPGTTSPGPAAKPNGIPKSAPAIPAKKTFLQPAASQPATAKANASQPAIALAATIQKPTPAKLHFALAPAPQFEPAFAALAPGQPRRQPDMSPVELPHGLVVPWDSRVEIADSLAAPVERKLDLREVSRQTPRIALDLRIVPPDSLRTESRTLTIAAASVAPGEASLSIIPYCDFVSELITLSDFADAQFSKSDFEPPTLVEGSAECAVPAPILPESQSAAQEREAPRHEIVPPAPMVPVPDPQLTPLPVSSAGIAPARTKPLPVFGPVPIGSGTIQVPQPNGLPLRPLMVLAAVSAPKPVKNRNAGVPSPGISVKPSPDQPKTPLPAPDLGLPELRTPDAFATSASRMRAILAALAGVALLAAAILFFVSQKGNRGVKAPATALSNGALGSQWIANFAPDARRQRKVSLLQSSLNLQSYRVEFESSIKIKALGWVYRAQDSKNFYVSKIEFQKPGVNPVYALVHYAVIEGVEQPRSATSLHLSVPMGGVYKIRFEAVGNHFATWVQGQRAEQWTDSRLSSGGAGLYSEGVEQSILHGDFVVTPLLKENESR